jgi:hypothetical protein
LLSAGTVALRTLEAAGQRRTYEDLKPTRFVPGPAGDGQVAEYPWVAKSSEKADFLGNEFLLWLWWQAETTQNDYVMIDQRIDLDCAFGESGRDVLRGVSVGQMPEAKKALQAGKVPRTSHLLACSAEQYSFTLVAELLSVAGLTLPNIENADTPRTFFEERIDQLRGFAAGLDAIYQKFLKARTGGHWETTVAEIRNWIQQAK